MFILWIFHKINMFENGKIHLSLNFLSRHILAFLVLFLHYGWERDGENQLFLLCKHGAHTHLSRLVTKPTKWLCAQRRLIRLGGAQTGRSSAKTQISLGIRPVWSDSYLCAQWVAVKGSKHSSCGQRRLIRQGGTPRLIWVFARRTCHFVDFAMRRLILNSEVHSLMT